MPAQALANRAAHNLKLLCSPLTTYDTKHHYKSKNGIRRSEAPAKPPKNRFTRRLCGGRSRKTAGPKGPKGRVMPLAQVRTQLSCRPLDGIFSPIPNSMKILISVLPFILILCCGFQSNTKEEILLFFAGAMHKEEVKAKNNEEWFGLYELSNGFSLIKSKITVSAILDSNGMYDTEVLVDQTLRPHFLVKGSGKFTEGFVKTVYRGSLLLTPTRECRFFWEGVWYNIAASGYQKGESIKNYEITLYGEDESQRIVLRPNAYVDGLPSIMWVGDLDRDNKPDLLIDLSDHYNASEPTLFLSSYASNKELVQRVAYHRSTGC
jgi:hypothetical protein